MHLSRAYSVRGALAFIGLVAVVFQSRVLDAQGFLQPGNPNQPSGRFIEPPRIVTQQLREAEKSIAEQRYSDAVVRLGDLLQRDAADGLDIEGAGQDYFVDADDDELNGRVVTESLLRRARRLIGELPPQGLEIYELRYGALARKILDDASNDHEWSAVELVRRQYFHTVAGYEASMLLARREWYLGRPLGTYLMLEELMASPMARTRLGSSLETLYLSAARIAGQEVEIPSQANVPEWVEPLAQTQADGGSAGSTAPGEEYRWLGGTPSRNGGDNGEMPLANPRWRVETTASSRQERTLRQRSDEMSTRSELPPPSFIPLKVGDQLLMRTTERLVGVDYRTGKRVWEYPWYSAYEGFDEDEESFDAIPGDEGPGDLLSQRVWNDLPYGQMSSDGERVFVLDDLGQVEMASFSPIIGLQGTRPADAGRNSLVALDLKTQGKLLWQIGSGEEQASAFSDVFFLGPPLPLDGNLYVMIEVAGDLCLSCLDPRTGSEHWRQQLVAIESGGVDVDPVRRVAGAMPTYHRGVLICPTGAGAVVAVDLVDRMLRWGRAYDRNVEQSNSLFNGTGLDQNQLMKRWYSGAAIAIDDTVLLTPIESDRLFALDLLTGEESFPEKPRVKMRYLAGVRNERIIVVGSNQVRALHLRTGETVWSTPSDWLAAGQQVSGLGVFGDDEYLVPTTNNQLIRISLNDGSVLERRTTRFPLGNLVASDGELISQSPTLLSVAFGEQSLEPVVTAMLAKDPDNFEAMVRKAELLIQSGERDSALEYLSRARSLDPDSDEVHVLSISAMLGSLREKPQIDGPIVELLERLIDRPRERIELLALRVQAGLDQGKYVATSQLLVEMSEQIRLESAHEDIDLVAMTDSSRQCVLDCWIDAHLKRAYSRANEDQRAEIDAIVNSSVASLTDASSGVLQRVVRHFGSTQSISELRRLFAKRLLSEESLLRAERLSLGTFAWSQNVLRELPGDRIETLLEASLEGGFIHNAFEAVDAMDFEKIAKSQPERAAELSTMRSLPQSGNGHEWPKTAELTWDELQRSNPRTSLAFIQSIAQTSVTGGPEFEGWKLVSEYQNPIAFRNRDGQLRGVPLEGRNQRDDGEKEAIINGGVSVVVTMNELVCIDMYELARGTGESILWRRDWGGDSGASAKRRSQPTPLNDYVFRYVMNSATAQVAAPEFRVGPILGDRVVMLQGGDLVALDLFTSEPLWRNSNAPRSGWVLSDGHQVLVISPDSQEVVLFDALDGSKLGTKAWTYGDIWTAQNRCVICYSQPDNNRQTTVRMIDVFADQVVQELTTDVANRGTDTVDASFGRVIDGRYLVVLNNRGELWLWDVQAGREVGRCTLPNKDGADAKLDLRGIRAVLLEDQLLVLPHLRSDADSHSLGIDTVTMSPSQQHQTTHGIYAISLKDGSLNWSYDDGSAWGVTLHQPAATPIILLCRSHSVNPVPGVSRTRTLDVLALDVRDGSVVDKRLGRQVQPQGNEIETRVIVQPPSDRVIVHIGSEMLTYNFGETAVREPADQELDVDQ